MNAHESPYARIGGGPAIRTAVDRFYRLVLDDPELAPYFADVDLARLKRHQAQLLSSVLGGSEEYTGRDLAAAHLGRGITGAHYAKVVDHLVGVLRELDAPADVIEAVAQTVGGVRDQIVDPADTVE
jgi:hemoglobin